MKSVKIFSVFHKPYWIPSDDLYEPIQVGYGDSIYNQGIKISRDDTGNNISDKNQSYCELTAIYWVWKNKKYDYIGVDHYRRHFCISKSMEKKKCILHLSEIQDYLFPDVIILPKKRHYWIETNYSQYSHAHNEIDLIKTREIIQEKYPDYLDDYDFVMKKRSGHRFNMMIMPWILFDSYCTWLFAILFELEKVLDISKYSDSDKRVFGYVAERLLDVFLVHKKIEYYEMNYVFMDKEKWCSKIFSFIKRKLYGAKNE